MREYFIIDRLLRQMFDHQREAVQQTDTQSSIRATEKSYNDRCDLCIILLICELSADAHDQGKYFRPTTAKFDRLEELWQDLDLEKFLGKVVGFGDCIEFAVSCQ